MKQLLLLFCALYSLQVYSQNTTARVDTLSADEAVRIALENNYDIRLSRTDAEIARLNNTRANAGMLPTVGLVAGENVSVNAFQYQKFFDGRTNENYGVLANTLSAGVQLNWTLYDGRRMQITKKRLEELERLGTLNLQTTVQNTTSQVLQAYYAIVQGRLQERALEEVIALNEERLRIAEARLAAGFAAQTDALQARIDLNQRRSDLLTQQNATAGAKRSLNRLLVRPTDTPFEVNENLANSYSPDRNTLIQKILSQNPTLLALQKNADVAALIVEENRTLNKPRIVGTGQFNAQRADNGAGILLNNTQTGLAAGATLSIPLYTGGNIRRQVETAKLAAQQASLITDAQRLSFETDLDNQLTFYQTQQQILDLESDNVRIARENLNVSTERFRVGTTNGLEIQTAQNTLEQALVRRNLVLFNLKSAEIRLRLLAGEL
jgi:outer membrane protein TolC